MDIGVAPAEDATMTEFVKSLLISLLPGGSYWLLGQLLL